MTAAALRTARLEALLQPVGAVVVGTALLAVGLVARILEARGALLYPDGYQYLLMARGIGDHLRPTIQLGPRGDVFIPNPDASLKPLFPAAVALAHLAGAGWTGAARAVSVAAGAASVALCGLLAMRLTGSRLLGTIAGLVVLLEPTERYWAAFSSPDALGTALALGAALAVAASHPRAGGVLAGLAGLARPELGLLLVAGATVLVLRSEHRRSSLGFLTAALATAAVALALLRPPLQLSLDEAALAAAGAFCAAAIAVLAPPKIGVAAGLAALGLAATRGSALAGVLTRELVLALLFVAALVVARDRRAAAVVSVAAGALALAYETRNGASARYLTQLVPLAAVGIAIGAAQARAALHRVVAYAAAALGVAALASHAPAPAPGPDMFHAVASALPRTDRLIATSAADAYGFLLYPRSVRRLSPGARGLLLVDATTRAYEPGLAVRGRTVARLPVGNGFLAPGGRVDERPALLIEGAAR
jgi:hypothetical protein